LPAPGAGYRNVQRVMINSIKKAMILAAGEGTRMRPLTLETSKVLLPIGVAPLICYTFTWLANFGIREVAINLFHHGGKIREFLGDGSKFGMKIHYSNEKTLLGSAGGVKKVDRLFTDTFVVVYGDVLTDFNLSAMIEFHRRNKAMLTVAATRVPNPWEKGIIQMENDGRITSFVEKPAPGKEPGNLANGGIYVLEREVLDFIPARCFCDFAFDIFPRLLAEDCRVYAYVLEDENYLLDIGTLDKYQKANEDVKLGRVKINCKKPGLRC
jgi:mannose-1-phosphate guanylyltransferase / phosphomannomutase